MGGIPGGRGKGGVMADKFGFFRSYGGSTTRPDDGSMDIELLDSAHVPGTPVTPVQAHTTTRTKLEEAGGVAATPMGVKGLDAAV